MRKDSEFVYYGEVRKEIRQMITDTAMNMMISPKYEAKGMEAEEANAYDSRVAHYNDGVLELARNLLKALEEDDDDG